MRLPLDFRGIFEALERENVRYVTVGGLAVVLHGVDRLTADIDLVIDLAPESAQKAIRVLLELGMKSRLPVDPVLFADPDIRKSWIQDKGMKVFSFWDPESRYPTIDLFVDYPMAFDELWQDAREFDLDGTQCRIASIAHLIAIKRKAGRDKDIEDVKRLERIRDDD